MRRPQKSSPNQVGGGGVRRVSGPELPLKPPIISEKFVLVTLSNQTPGHFSVLGRIRSPTGMLAVRRIFLSCLQKSCRTNLASARTRGIDKVASAMSCSGTSKESSICA